jgi:hypothetical protein
VRGGGFTRAFPPGGFRNKELLYLLRPADFNRGIGAKEAYFADFPACTASASRLRVLMGT